MFSSWETEAAAWQQLGKTSRGDEEEGDGYEHSTEAETTREREEDEEEARLQLLALFSAVAGSGSSRAAGLTVDNHPPEHHPQDDLLPSIPRREGGGDTTPPDLLITGSLSETLLPLLTGPDLAFLEPSPVISRDKQRTREQLAQARASLSFTSPIGEREEETEERKRRGVISSISIPYIKWLIPSSPQDAHVEDPPPLPQNYTFSPLQPPNDLAHVLTRTAIPRTIKTLASLGSVGVRYSPPPLSSSAPDNSNPACNSTAANRDDDGELIAWSFLGVDGSLSSLHVEPPHRGRGLAKSVCRRLFAGLAFGEEGMGFRILPGVTREAEEGLRGLVHSDVAEGNVESAGVARGLGGRVGWRVRWVGVHLGRVRDVVGAMEKEGGEGWGGRRR